MRVLVMATPSSTHFATLVPLAWACRAAGHEVLVFGQPDITGVARSAGLPAVEIGDRFDVLEMIGGGLPPGKRPIETGHGRVQGNQWGAAARTWVLHAKYLVDRYLAAAREWQPDVILADPLEYSALILGGVLGVPTVHHRWGVDPLGGPGRRAAQKILSGRAVRMGAPQGVPAPTLIVDPTPPRLQVPDADPAQPVRLVPYNGGGVLPEWLGEAPDGVRVCVSFGRLTPALNGGPLIRHVVDAFDGWDGVTALLALDREYWPDEVPANVRLVDSVPLSLLLEGCAAVVHHGGAATGMTATSYGLPQLVLPGMMDAFVYSERIAGCGAGIGLDEQAAQDDPAVIRAALRDLIQDADYRKHAAELADEMRAMPTPAELVATIERLT